MNDTIKIVCEALEDIGICTDFDISDLLINDLDLRDYIPDSITYIYFIISLEDKMGVVFPDQAIIFEQMSSIKGLAKTIEAMCNSETSI